EPSEIALLYKDRDTILSTMREGIIAVNTNRDITLVNEIAQNILNVDHNVRGMNIHSLIPSLSGRLHENLIEEMMIHQVPVILKCAPLTDGEGAVITIVDKTEIQELTDTLQIVKQYADELRAQTHEFSNKLYVFLGLIQL